MNHSIRKLAVPLTLALAALATIVLLAASPAQAMPNSNKPCPENPRQAAQTILNREVGITETSVISRFVFIGDTGTGSCGWWMLPLDPRPSGLVSVTVWSNVHAEWWNWWVTPNFLEVYDQPNPEVTSSADEATFWWYADPPTPTPTATSTSTATPTPTPTGTVTSTHTLYLPLIVKPLPTIPAGNPKCPNTPQEAAQTFVGSTDDRWVKVAGGGCVWQFLGGEAQTFGVPLGYWFSGTSAVNPSMSFYGPNYAYNTLAAIVYKINP